MPARRRLLAVSSALLSAVALTACESPTPLVTLVSGGESTYSEAAVFCFEEGQTVDSGDCAEREQGVTELRVSAGQQVGIDVGKDLVERGWQATLLDPANPEGSVQRTPVQDDHWYAFPAPPLRPGTRLLLTISALGEGDAATGEWQFALVPTDEGF